MPALDESFPDVVAALTRHYGLPATPLDGAGTSFLAVAVAVLAGAPDARRIEAAREALDDAGWGDARALSAADPVEIREALKEAGVALTPKAVGPLLRLARWLVEAHEGDAEALRGEGLVSISDLREEMLALNGVGPATADSLLLFALRRPVYPVDRATYRVLVRHGWLEPSAGYDDARDVVERRLDGDALGLARVSVWMERIGRDFCRATVAKCERCPLQPFLPASGVAEPE